jgi:hypothetical protein
MPIRATATALLISVLLTLQLTAKNRLQHAVPYSDTVRVTVAIINHHLTPEWTKALVTRMSKEKLDSLASIQRPLSPDECDWLKLIRTKTGLWNSLRDSLETPFGDIHVTDTINVLLGAFGVDDGFTFQYNTVCFDLTALQANYGSALLPENIERIDRLFAHEYTHLIHKTWVQERDYAIRTFKDSVLWECLYEGIGMYRSLTKKWLPQGDALPDMTRNTLEELYPVFVQRLIAVASSVNPSKAEKARLVSNLSRGPVHRKWGALPVAIWLALEANGDDTQLTSWLNKGPGAVIELAKKYLPDNYNISLESKFR